MEESGMRNKPEFRSDEVIFRYLSALKDPVSRSNGLRGLFLKVIVVFPVSPEGAGWEQKGPLFSGLFRNDQEDRIFNPVDQFLQIAGRSGKKKICPTLVWGKSVEKFLHALDLQSAARGLQHLKTAIG